VNLINPSHLVILSGVRRTHRRSTCQVFMNSSQKALQLLTIGLLWTGARLLLLLVRRDESWFPRPYPGPVVRDQRCRERDCCALM
jgi:hypothetical protein